MELQLLWTPWSIALILHSFIWDVVLINKRCLLPTMGSGWGEGKTHLGKREHTFFFFWRQTLLSTIQALENLGENNGFDCFSLCNFLYRLSILVALNFRLLFSNPHGLRNGASSLVTLQLKEKKNVSKRTETIKSTQEARTWCSRCIQ